MKSNIEEKVTLQTISEALGISKTTVSLVLKGDGDRYRISRKTQKRISDYAAKSGFRPDFLAKALATNKTSTIGVVFPDVHEAFMSEMVRGIESVIYNAGYSIMLSTSGFNSDFEQRNIRQLIHRKVDGIIIAPYIPISDKDFSHSYLEELGKAKCPVVFVDRVPPENKDLSWIVQDDYDSARNAVKLLCNLGCRNPACLSFNLNISSISNRLRGYFDEKQQLYPYIQADNLFLLDRQDSESDDLYRKLKTMTESENPVDGLLVTTGGIADKARNILESPEFSNVHMKIIKFGKDPEYFKSGTIQIIQPNTEMGRMAAKTILAQISTPSKKPVQLKIKSEIIGDYYETE